LSATHERERAVPAW